MDNSIVILKYQYVWDNPFNHAGTACSTRGFIHDPNVCDRTGKTLNTAVRVLSLVNTALEDGVQILVLIAYAQKSTPDLRQLHVGNFTC